MKHAEEVALAGGGLDRAAHLRGKGEALAELLEHGGDCILPVWRGKPLMALSGASARAGLLAPDHPMLAQSRGTPLFLGLTQEGAARFAVDVSAWEPPEGTPAPGGFRDATRQALPGTAGGEPAFTELRMVLSALDRASAALCVAAQSILNWHRRHGFCANCGAVTDIAQAGWQRNCPACGAAHFPRTDPVAIMLVTHGNSVLLGRSPGWPEGMYSLLAGFVEPGETMEDAVRREVHEETGVRVGPVRYLSSQPWPYPSSLMLGCHGEAEGRDITLDPAELDDALWLTREEALAVVAGLHPQVQPPRKGAIAEFLLRNWLADSLQ